MKKSKLLLMSLLLVGCVPVIKPVETTTTTAITTTASTATTTIKQAKRSGTATYKAASAEDNTILQVNYENDIVKTLVFTKNESIPDELPKDLSDSDKGKLEQILLDKIIEENSVKGVTFDVTLTDQLTIMMTMNLSEIDVEEFDKTFGGESDKDIQSIANIMKNYMTFDYLDKDLKSTGYIRID